MSQRKAKLIELETEIIDAINQYAKQEGHTTFASAMRDLINRQLVTNGLLKPSDISLSKTNPYDIDPYGEQIYDMLIQCIDQLKTFVKRYDAINHHYKNESMYSFFEKLIHMYQYDDNFIEKATSMIKLQYLQHDGRLIKCSQLLRVFTDRMHARGYDYIDWGTIENVTSKQLMSDILKSAEMAVPSSEESNMITFDYNYFIKLMHDYQSNQISETDTISKISTYIENSMDELKGVLV